METIVLDTYDLIEDELAKAGKKPPKDAYNIISALPFVTRSLEKHATKTEYSACCVDKAFYIVNKALNLTPQPTHKDK